MRFIVPLGAVCLVVCFSADAQTQQSRPAAKTTVDKKTTTVKPATAMSGQRVHIDPATRKIKDPDPEELQADAAADAAASAAAPALTPIIRADGTIALDLRGQMLDSAVVKKNADGTLTFDCIKGAKEASEAVKTGKVGAQQSSKQGAFDEK